MMSTLSALVAMTLICCLGSSGSPHTPAAWVSNASISFHSLGKFQAKAPSFIAVQVEPTSSQEDGEHLKRPLLQNWTLLVSSFSASPFSKDGVYLARNVQDNLISGASEISLTEISDQVVWPNEFRLVPEAVFKEDVACAATGFLVPGKTKGTVSLFDMSSGPVSGPHVITSTSTPWFYHRVIWHDMNNDGRLDALTARADKPILGSTKTELLWLEHPESDPLNSVWQEHSLLEGPDVFIILLELPVNNSVMPFVVSANYFSKTLELIWPAVDSTSGHTDWSPQSISHKVIDQVDAPFDMKPVDANGDGRLDLVVSINNEKNGSLVIYEIPPNFQEPNVQWPRHVVRSGYHAIKEMVGRGSPGSIFPVCPLTSSMLTNGSCYCNATSGLVKPSFLLSGDDGGNVYLLSPSDPPQPWSYSEQTVIEIEGTVGQLAVEKIVGNAYQLFVPDYSGNMIHVLST